MTLIMVHIATLTKSSDPLSRVKRSGFGLERWGCLGTRLLTDKGLGQVWGYGYTADCLGLSYSEVYHSGIQVFCWHCVGVSLPIKGSMLMGC